MVMSVGEWIHFAGNHQSFVADVSSSSSVQALVKDVRDAFNQAPQCVVNCAGITRDGFLLKMKESSFDEVINVNLKVGRLWAGKVYAEIFLQCYFGKPFNMVVSKAEYVGIHGLDHVVSEVVHACHNNHPVTEHPGFLTFHESDDAGLIHVLFFSWPSVTILLW